MNSHLPHTGTEDFFELLSPFVPDDYWNERWPRLQTGGRRHHFSAAQLWRLHLLALITPVHSFNLRVVPGKLKNPNKIRGFHFDFRNTL